MESEAVMRIQRQLIGIDAGRAGSLRELYESPFMKYIYVLMHCGCENTEEGAARADKAFAILISWICSNAKKLSESRNVRSMIATEALGMVDVPSAVNVPPLTTRGNEKELEELTASFELLTEEQRNAVMASLCGYARSSSYVSAEDSELERACVKISLRMGKRGMTAARSEVVLTAVGRILKDVEYSEAVRTMLLEKGYPIEERAEHRTIFSRLSKKRIIAAMASVCVILFCLAAIASYKYILAWGSGGGGSPTPFEFATPREYTDVPLPLLTPSAPTPPNDVEVERVELKFDVEYISRVTRSRYYAGLTDETPIVYHNQSIDKTEVLFTFTCLPDAEIEIEEVYMEVVRDASGELKYEAFARCRKLQYGLDETQGEKQNYINPLRENTPDSQPDILRIKILIYSMDFFGPIYGMTDEDDVYLTDYVDSVNVIGDNFAILEDNNEYTKTSSMISTMKEIINVADESTINIVGDEIAVLAEAYTYNYGDALFYVSGGYTLEIISIGLDVEYAQLQKHIGYVITCRYIPSDEPNVASRHIEYFQFDNPYLNLEDGRSLEHELPYRLVLVG